ncbi:hypothetical protein IWQ62_002515 [Dispira parvispora]|uniref:EKC/KEOPS complex subunit CGI121 n=1 Tax=Dispira parvispora TaxID=1520584 RepID=A0A9W8AQ75_9FUNG|nr:hypothetical protein IWQ62_002515 [Dispira parvispora]
MSLTQSQPLQLHDQATQVHVALWINVSNASELHQRLLGGDTTVNCALINPEAVVDPFQVMVAVHRAAEALEQQQLRTRNIYSEIVYNLSPNKSIKEAFTRFGLNPTCKTILAVRVGGSQEAFDNEVGATIVGEPAALERLSSVTSLDKVRQYYKLPANTSNILNAAVGAMALKGYT